MDKDLHIYCINLKYRKDRWIKFNAQTEVQLLQSLYSFERFDAVVGKKIDIENDARISMRTRRNILDRTRRDHEELDTPGGVGCYLSHTTVWKQFLDRKEEYAMIFEDDAILSVNFVHMFQSAVKDIDLLPQKPDIWYFSGPTRWYYESKGRPLPHTVAKNNIGPWVTPYCSTFTGYVINKHGARQLLEAAFPIDMHVDLYSCLVGDMGKLFSVHHKNISIGQDMMLRTDIQTEKSCKICDIPTSGLSTSTIVLPLPVLLVGVTIVGVLLFIREFSGKK